MKTLFVGDRDVGFRVKQVARVRRSKRVVVGRKKRELATRRSGLGGRRHFIFGGYNEKVVQNSVELETTIMM